MNQPANNNLDIRSLPSVLTEIIDVIGLAATTRLLERLGGRSLHVPREVRPEHPLTMLIGPEAAAHMVARYRLERIDLPKYDTLVRALRDTEIRRRRAAGESPSVLAEEYWLTERHIRRIAPMDDD